MSPTDPVDRPPFDPERAFAALARHVDRTDRRVTALDELLATLANDVAELATRQAAEHVPPLSWLLLDDPTAGVEALEDLASWLWTVYLRYADAVLPACWLWHDDVVEELMVLRQSHREAFDEQSRSVSRAADWHDRYRPGVVKRLTKLARECSLSEHSPDGSVDAAPRPVPMAGSMQRMASSRARTVKPWPTEAELDEAAKYETTPATNGRRP